MEKANVCLCRVLVIFLALSSFISFAGIFVFGGLGIENAKVDNDERYIRAYCNAEDNSEYVWTLWMAGSTAAAILFWLLGTTTIVVGLKLARSLKTNSSAKSLEKMTCPACVTVFSTSAFLSIALILLMWCVAIAYNNARIPNKTISFYILVDCLLGIVMPLSLIAAGITGSVFLMYITNGRLDARNIIAKMLSIKLKKPKGVENAKYCWIIHKTVYFQLTDRDTSVKSDIAAKNENISFCRSISSSGATWILATIVSISFLLSMSYFIDRTVIMSQTFQDWPPRSLGDLDCFLPIGGSLDIDSSLYVSPIEQVSTDRLNNCTVFFEQCQSNCSADNFQSCAQICANCLTLCTNTLRSDLEVVRVCDPPPVNDDGPSCPVSNAACITAATVLPQDNTSCSTAQGTQGSGDAGAEIAPIIVTNNTQRLERCAGLLDTCSMLVSMCTAPNCTELQQCNDLLQECRKPPFIVCFSFLQFGHSTNLLQALAESYALFMFAVSLFSAIFGVVCFLLQIHETKLWGFGFLAMVIILIVVGLPIFIKTGILFNENFIRVLQFVLGPIYILLVGSLFPFAYFPNQQVNPKTNDERMETKKTIVEDSPLTESKKTVVEDSPQTESIETNKTIVEDSRV